MSVGTIQRVPTRGHIKFNANVSNPRTGEIRSNPNGQADH